MSLSYGFALEPTDNAEVFSAALHALTGDGVSGYGSRFALTLSGGFKVTLAPGYVLVNGRYMKLDEPYTLTLSPSGDNRDRYDAIAARAVYGEKTVTPTLLVDIDPAALRENPALIRGEDSYSVVLYIVHVRKGETVLEAGDIEDTRADALLCGGITGADSVSRDVQRVYDFLNSGIDAEVEAVLEQSRTLVDRADRAIATRDAAIQVKNHTATGELTTSRHRPSPAWLLCDGGPVPEGYEELSALLGGTLPEISPADTRFKTYIFGGVPA